MIELQHSGKKGNDYVKKASRTLLVLSLGLALLGSVSVGSVSAQVDVDSCERISHPGDYQLTEDIIGDHEGEHGCIEIVGDEITVDGMGNSVEASGGEGVGIVVSGAEDVTVENFDVSGWETGVSVVDSDSVSVLDADIGGNDHLLEVEGSQGLWTDSLDIGASTQDGTTVGFGGDDVRLGTVEPEAPSPLGYSGVDRYVEVEDLGDGEVHVLQIYYEDGDVSDEDSLEMWKHDGEEWEERTHFVNTEANYVGTEFPGLSIYGLYQETGVITGNTVDGDGDAVEDVDVEVIDESTDEIVANVNSGADAQYEVDVPTGTYTVKGEKSGYVQFTEEEFEVVPGTQALDIQLEEEDIEPTGTIEGTVTDEDGEPIEDAEVAGMHTGTGDTWNTVTDSEGMYSKEVPVGDHDFVVAQADGYLHFGPDFVTIQEDETTELDITLEEEPTGTVQGWVKDSDGETMADADLSIEDVDGSSWQVNADEDGFYSLELPADESYVVNSDEIGYTTQEFDVQVDIEEDETTEQNITLIDPSLTVEDATVEGKVEERINPQVTSPVEGTEVEFRNLTGETLETTTTDSEGRYSQDIQTGAFQTVRVLVDEQGFEEFSTIMVLSGGDEVTRDIELVRDDPRLEWSTDLNEVHDSAIDASIPIESSPTIVDGSVHFGSDGGLLYSLDAITGEKEWYFSGDVGSMTASPNVVDGTAYITTEAGILYAVDTSDGETEWDFEVDDPNDHPNLVISSPTVKDGIVYVGSNNQTVHAVDAGSGEEEWSHEVDLTHDPEPDTVDEHLDGAVHQSSPVVKDGTVYINSGIGSEGKLTAIDADTGDFEWDEEIGLTMASAPTVSEDGSTVYTRSSWTDNISAIDASDGSTNWEVELEGSTVRSTPTVADGTLYIGDTDNTLHAIDTTDGEVDWTFEADEQIRSSPTVADGVVYVGGGDSVNTDAEDGHLYAVDADEGTEEWSYEMGPVGSSPTVVEGTVYVGSNDGKMYALSTTELGTLIPSGPILPDVDTSQPWSEDTRVNLGTLGHHEAWEDRASEPPWVIDVPDFDIDPVPSEETIIGVPWSQELPDPSELPAAKVRMSGERLTDEGEVVDVGGVELQDVVVTSSDMSQYGFVPDDRIEDDGSWLPADGFDHEDVEAVDGETLALALLSDSISEDAVAGVLEDSDVFINGFPIFETGDADAEEALEEAVVYLPGDGYNIPTGTWFKDGERFPGDRVAEGSEYGSASGFDEGSAFVDGEGVAETLDDEDVDEDLKEVLEEGGLYVPQGTWSRDEGLLSPDNPFLDEDGLPLEQGEVSSKVFSWLQDEEIDGVEYERDEVSGFVFEWLQES